MTQILLNILLLPVGANHTKWVSSIKEIEVNATMLLILIFFALKRHDTMKFNKNDSRVRP